MQTHPQNTKGMVGSGTMTMMERLARVRVRVAAAADGGAYPTVQETTPTPRACMALSCDERKDREGADRRIQVSENARTILG